MTVKNISKNNNNLIMEEIKNIDIDKIKVDETTRLRKKGDIEPIKNSIESLGFLINPITIDSDNNLIAGYHRFWAYKELHKTEIPARIIDKNIDKKLVEIDENLIRNDLTALETAQQLKMRKEIYEKIYPESKSENIKRNNFASVYTTKSFTKDMAEKTQKTQRWVQNYIEIANKLTPESVQKIKGTKLENNFILLQNISKKVPKEQSTTIEFYLNTSNKKEKPIKQLATKYKIDFVRKMVVVNGKWTQLPENYDIENKSYTQMVIDIKNPEKI